MTLGQIESYQQAGVVVVEGLLDAEELQTWRTYVDEAVANRQDRKLALGDMKSGVSYYDKVFTQRLNLWVDHQGMRSLMLAARLGKMATELAEVNGIRTWHDQALIKEPWANPTAWHLDNPYRSFSSRNDIAIWRVLYDATLDNGCLYFLPGAHRERALKIRGLREICRTCLGSIHSGLTAKRRRHR